MKNILKQGPSGILTARLQHSIEFVVDKDIKSKKVLDIGCGFGWFEKNILQRGVGKAVGIEISVRDLKAAKTIKDKRVSFSVAGALDIPYKNNYFDTVVSWEVLEHIPKNTEHIMFTEVHRVLKKGGVFYLSTPFASFPSTVLDPAWWLIGHRHYSQQKLQNFAKKAGFTQVQIHTKGKIWVIVSMLNMYISKWFFHRASFFENFFIQKEFEDYQGKKGFVTLFARFEKKN